MGIMCRHFVDTCYANKWKGDEETGYRKYVFPGMSPENFLCTKSWWPNLTMAQVSSIQSKVNTKLKRVSLEGATKDWPSAGVDKFLQAIHSFNND